MPSVVVVVVVVVVFSVDSADRNSAATPPTTRLHLSTHVEEGDEVVTTGGGANAKAAVDEQHRMMMMAAIFIVHSLLLYGISKRQGMEADAEMITATSREHSALFQKENYFVRSMATMTLVLTSVAVFLFLGSGNTGRRTAER